MVMGVSAGGGCASGNLVSEAARASGHMCVCVCVWCVKNVNEDNA